MKTESFIPTKNSDFPIQNLPYGVARTTQTGTFVGVAIGDQILNLSRLEADGVLKGTQRFFDQTTLNTFMGAGKKNWTDIRGQISSLLRSDNPKLRDHPQRSHYFVPLAQAEMLLPARIGDYTDFYSSKEHATNIGIMIRDKNQPLLPNWKHLPVGYHGRSSSVVVSGTPVYRPCGQVRPKDDTPPLFAQSQRLDFELEVACFVGSGNALGEPIPLERAEDHIFGLVLLNDWSARDIQRWEYMPLGPFVSKSFATSISPWVIPLEALEPFRTEQPPPEEELLPYLQQKGAKPSGFDIHLEVSLGISEGQQPTKIAHSNTKYLYWSMAQQIAHHTVAGCPLRPGDLLASGTISSPEPTGYGSLMELSWNGTKPLSIGNATRTFLQDGDEVIMSAWCESSDGLRLGFGEVKGRILPPRT